MDQLIFSREIKGRLLTVRFDEDARTISIEADGNTISTVRVDRHGDVIAYTPATDEEIHANLA